MGRLEAHKKVCLSVFNGKKKLSGGSARSKKAANTAAVVSPDAAAASKQTPRSSGTTERKNKVASSPLFVCHDCGYSECSTREELLKHMRSCSATKNKNVEATGEVRATFGGRAKAGQVCPYCAQPTIKLSNHLSRCRHYKKAMEKNQGVLPGMQGARDEGVMSMTC